LLRPIVDSGKTIAVGLLDVKNLWIEPVELIVARLQTCLQFAPAEALHVTADCGYSQTARYAAIREMTNMAQAVKQVCAEKSFDT
jgi:5-methyltetrahydropteroyltriglutamate--homocysteine methyltransferase